MKMKHKGKSYKMADGGRVNPLMKLEGYMKGQAKKAARNYIKEHSPKPKPYSSPYAVDNSPKASPKKKHPSDGRRPLVPDNVYKHKYKDGGYVNKGDMYGDYSRSGDCKHIHRKS